jgi:hypothetical protein
MALPAGRALVVVAGLAVAGYGAYQLYRAAKKDVTKRLALTGVGADARRWVERAGRFGIGARGVVFTVMAGSSARRAAPRPGQAGRPGRGARALERGPGGGVLLTIVALGFMAYGVWQTRERPLAPRRGRRASRAARTPRGPAGRPAGPRGVRPVRGQFA